MTVVVRGSVIEAVLPDAEVSAELIETAESVDLTGRYLLPGLIDTHQHLATPPDREKAQAWLRRQIFGGVTAIRDMADDLRQISDLTRAALVGEIPAPDIAYAALMAGPGFFADPRTWQVSQGLEPGGLPWMKAIDSASDIPTEVTLARGTSAAAIKIYADLQADLVREITEQAHRQGLQVWAHAAVFPSRPSQVVASGVDSISHAQMLGYEFATDAELISYASKRPPMPETFDDEPTAEIARLLDEMRDRGIILDATTSMWDSVETAGRPTRDADRRAAIAFTGQSHRAGVDVSTGTDYETPLDDPYPSLHRELRFLVEEVGMSTTEVLRSATAVGAKALGQQRLMGSVEPGKLANLLVLTADPTADIRNIGQIAFVVKRGRRFHPQDRTGGSLTTEAASAAEVLATSPKG
jgi:imidazolonepropionase-like amidohydrolase